MIPASYSALVRLQDSALHNCYTASLALFQGRGLPVAELPSLCGPCTRVKRAGLTHSRSEEGANSLPWSGVPLAEGCLQVGDNGLHSPEHFCVNYSLVWGKSLEIQTRRGIRHIRPAGHPGVKCKHTHCLLQQRASVSQETQSIRLARHLEQSHSSR